MDNVFHQLIVRLINTTDCNGYYLMDTVGNVEFDLVDKSMLLDTIDETCLTGQIIVVFVTAETYRTQLNSIEEYCKNNIVVICSENYIADFYETKSADKTYYLRLCGQVFEYAPSQCNETLFKVLAIVHFFNEEDVLRKTTEYLLSQGVDVYLIDNWSDDSSYTIAQQLEKEHQGHVFLERFPLDGKNDYYDWYHQLQRTEEISKTYDYDWFIHYDADEMRVGPWKGINLKDTIQYIDSLGYNLIENTVIDFKITDANESSIFMTDCWFEFGKRHGHFAQTKTWKKCDYIDLKSTGGHNAIVNNPRIYPLKMLNRHYPLRSVAHAKKKIFSDRKPRFEREKKERGWHGHYDSIKEDSDFLNTCEGLILWGNSTFEEYYIEFFTGCGVLQEQRADDNFLFESIPNNSRIVLYGAGKIGKALMEKIGTHYLVTHWVDRNYIRLPKMYCKEIESPDVIIMEKDSYDYVVIAIENDKIVNEVRDWLLMYGIDGRKILWKKR